MQVINDDREQTSEAMARLEVRCVTVALWPIHGGGVSVPGETSVGSANPVGTPMTLLQCGQICCVPSSAVSHKIFWPQTGHEIFNSLMGTTSHHPHWNWTGQAKRDKRCVSKNRAEKFLILGWENKNRFSQHRARQGACRTDQRAGNPCFILFPAGFSRPVLGTRRDDRFR